MSSYAFGHDTCIHAQVNKIASKSSFDKLVVVRVGPSGELQLVYSHDDPFVSSIAEMLVDSTSSSRAAEVVSRKMYDMKIEDLRRTIKLGVGTSAVHFLLLLVFHHVSAARRASSRRAAPEAHISSRRRFSH